MFHGHGIVPLGAASSIQAAFTTSRSGANAGGVHHLTATKAAPCRPGRRQGVPYHSAHDAPHVSEEEWFVEQKTGYRSSAFTVVFIMWRQGNVLRALRKGSWKLFRVDRARSRLDKRTNSSLEHAVFKKDESLIYRRLLQSIRAVVISVEHGQVANL